MDIRLPRLGEGADTGTIVSIFVKTGDKIKQSATILELENEKAVAPIPSPASGTVTKVHVKEGDKISVGQLLLSIADEGASSVSAAAEPAPAASHAAPQARAVEARPSGSGYQFKSPTGAEPPASPAVRKMAAELDIDLSRVRGSEHGGRITIDDVRAYVRWLQDTAFSGASAPAASQAPARPAPESIDFSKWGPVTKKAVSSLRKTIGQKMHESWSAIPHVTQFDDADITALMQLRKKYAPAYEKKGAALTLTAFAIKASVAALKKYPTFNSSLDEATGEIVLKQYYHIGIAVDTEQGLIVPVLRDADKKSLLEIAKELGELADKTRQRKIAIDDLKGGTFTISNLGSLGGGHFTPIVNKPEVAILGLGKGALKPVIVNKDKLENRMILPVCLSYDHRVVDGADGSRFIRELVTSFENFAEDQVKI